MEIKYIIILAIVFLLLIIVGLAIVNYSSEEMFDKFKKLQIQPCGISPVELANALNQVEFNGRIRMKYKDKYFSDSMASNFVLTLSSQYANSYNFGAVAICAHELGHAFQFRDKMQKMVKHARLVKISKFFSAIFNPLLFIGLILLAFGQTILGYVILAFAVISLLIAIVSKLSTIGVEKEASKNALEILRVYANFTDDELSMANGFLKSAKMTYVADLLKMMLKWTGLVRR